MCDTYLLSTFTRLVSVQLLLFSPKIILYANMYYTTKDYAAMSRDAYSTVSITNWQTYWLANILRLIFRQFFSPIMHSVDTFDIEKLSN